MNKNLQTDASRQIMVDQALINGIITVFYQGKIAFDTCTPYLPDQYAHTTTSNRVPIASVNREKIVRPANQIHDQNEPQAESDSDVAAVTAVTMPTNSNPDPADLCLQIRKGLWKLYDLDDRDDWQTDLVAYLLQQDNHDEDYDPLGDRRFEGIIKGVDLFFRFFEVRANLEFRHSRERFDPSGFLCLSWQSGNCTDVWWDSVSDKDIRVAEDLLVKAGLLEFRQVDTQNANPHFRFISFMRLRADRLIAALVSHDPDKYSFLNI